MKRTHKLGALGRDHVTAIITSAPSLGSAAKTLGVNRSSLYRWLKDEKVQKPQPSRRRRRSSGAAPRPKQSPQAWRRALMRRLEFGETEKVLLNLATEAYALSLDTGVTPTVRLAAM